MSQIYTIDAGYLEKYKDASWMETVTGRQFYPANPKTEDLTIFDIAHALSLKCRYNGHSSQFYSVAEHSVMLAMYARTLGLPLALQMELLLHDGSEAYLPDVPRPIKHFFPDLIVMEKILDGLIRHWVGLSGEIPPQVKEFDSRIIRDERVAVMLPTPNRWQTDALEPLGVAIQMWDAAVAERAFLQAYQVIGREMLRRPVLLGYEDGEFGTRYDKAIASDVRGYKPPNIRMIDIRGKCALATREDGPPYFINGEFDVYMPESVLSELYPA